MFRYYFRSSAVCLFPVKSKQILCRYLHSVGGNFETKHFDECTRKQEFWLVLGSKWLPLCATAARYHFAHKNHHLQYFFFGSNLWYVRYIYVMFYYYCTIQLYYVMNNDPLKKIFPPRFLNLISDYYYFLKKGAGNVANCSLTYIFIWRRSISRRHRVDLTKF